MANGKKIGSTWTEGTGQETTVFVQQANGIVDVSGKTYPKVKVNGEDDPIRPDTPDHGLEYTTAAPTAASLSPAARKALNDAGYTDDQITLRLVFGFKNKEQGRIGTEWRGQFTATGVKAAKNAIEAHMWTLSEKGNVKAVQAFAKKWKACKGDKDKLIALADSIKG